MVKFLYWHDLLALTGIHVCFYNAPSVISSRFMQNLMSLRALITPLGYRQISVKNKTK